MTPERAKITQDLVDLVKGEWCPYCDALPGEPCTVRSQSGAEFRVNIHVRRFEQALGFTTGKTCEECSGRAGMVRPARCGDHLHLLCGPCMGFCGSTKSAAPSLERCPDEFDDAEKSLMVLAR